MGRKPKQQFIDGTEPVKIKPIEDAAEEYVAVRDKRMNLTEDEVDLRGKLLELLKKNNLTEYKYDGYLVTVEHDEKVKVKKSQAIVED